MGYCSRSCPECLQQLCEWEHPSSSFERTAQDRTRLRPTPKCTSLCYHSRNSVGDWHTLGDWWWKLSQISREGGSCWLSWGPGWVRATCHPTVVWIGEAWYVRSRCVWGTVPPLQCLTSLSRVQTAPSDWQGVTAPVWSHQNCPHQVQHSSSQTQPTTTAVDLEGNCWI